MTKPPFTYEIALLCNEGVQHYGDYESWVAAYQAIPGMFQAHPELEWLTISKVVDDD